MLETFAIHTSAHLSADNLHSYRITAEMSSAPALPQSLKESVENSKAEYVHLGKSGLRVSIPILGAMSIGHPDWAPWVVDEEKVCPTISPDASERWLIMAVTSSTQSCIR